MRRVQTRDIANDLDDIVDAAQSDPIEIEAANGAIGVLLSHAALRNLIQSLETAIDRPELEPMMARSNERFAHVFRSLAKWEAEHEPPDEEPI